MILIIGANGHLGKAVTGFLLNKIEPNQMAVMTREPENLEDLRLKRIEILKGDYFDHSSLVKNFRKIDKLLFISSGTLQDRLQQHKNVVDAAKEAGVKHIYYTSYVNPIPDPYFKITRDHYETENYIRDSRLTYTIFRDATYMDELLTITGDAVNTGKIFYPAGDGKVSFATRNDEAEAIANVVLSEGHNNVIYNLDSDISYSFNDVANALSKVTGKKIEYIDIPMEQFQQEIKKTLPPFAVDLSVQMAQAIKHNEWNFPDPTLEKLLGRKPMGLEEFFKKHL